MKKDAVKPRKESVKRRILAAILVLLTHTELFAAKGSQSVSKQIVFAEYKLYAE